MSDLAARLALLPEAERRTALAGLSATELEAMLWHWPLWSRPTQLPPSECLAGDAALWVTCAGRGFGKTRTGSETIRSEVEAGRRGHIVIGGPTAQAIRRDLVEGPSGILATARPDFIPVYEPSSLRLTWPNGARAYLQRETFGWPKSLHARPKKRDGWKSGRLASAADDEQNAAQMGCGRVGPLGKGP